jgi:hypothetical protein
VANGTLSVHPKGSCPIGSPRSERNVATSRSNRVASTSRHFPFFSKAEYGSAIRPRAKRYELPHTATEESYLLVATTDKGSYKINLVYLSYFCLALREFANSPVCPPNRQYSIIRVGPVVQTLVSCSEVDFDRPIETLWNRISQMTPLSTRSHIG